VLCGGAGAAADFAGSEKLRRLLADALSNGAAARATRAAPLAPFRYLPFPRRHLPEASD